MKKARIGKIALILFAVAMTGFIIWNILYANAVYEKSAGIIARADAAIARSEESLRWHNARK